MISYIIAFLIAFRSEIVYSLVYSSKITLNPLKRASFMKLTKIANFVTSQDAALAEGFSNAFVGGTVGVMSVMFLLEFQKLQDTTLEGCPYCMGNGEILCASCFGQGTKASSEACLCCMGRGLVICVNCKGDGRETPLILQSKAVRDPEYATDGISIDSP
jgi:hypothetical protein